VICRAWSTSLDKGFTQFRAREVEEEKSGRAAGLEKGFLFIGVAQEKFRKGNSREWCSENVTWEGRIGRKDRSGGHASSGCSIVENFGPEKMIVGFVGYYNIEGDG